LLSLWPAGAAANHGAKRLPERAAFRFQPAARTITSDSTTERLELAVAPAAHAPPQPSKTEAKTLRIHHSDHATVAAACSRTVAKRAALRKQLRPRIHPFTGIMSRLKPTDSNYGITPFTVALAVLLGFSLLFIGIPLLIAAEFSLTFWAGLGYWLLAIAVGAFFLCFGMIVDAIGDLFRSEEKKQERYRQGKY
jgi:hypothetical protein